MTAAKADLQALSASSEERFITEWASGNTPYPLGPVDSMTLYKAYLIWCRDNGIGKPRDSWHFLAHVARRPGFESGKTKRYENLTFTPPAKQVRMVIPPDCVPSEGQGKQQWLTEGQVAFLRSLEGAQA